MSSQKVKQPSHSRPHGQPESHTHEETKHRDRNDEGTVLKDFFEYSTKREDLPGSEAVSLQMINSRRNVDLLCSGTKFIKGNQYDIPTKEKEKAKSGDEKKESGEEDKATTASPVEKREDRYFTDKSTIRCRNCKKFGHMSNDCPNERVSDRVCVYCADPAHSQFGCPNRLCFKCNQPGHKVADCPEYNPHKCFSCGQPGHKADACMVSPAPIGPKDQQRMVCMQCRRQGHGMCEWIKKLRVRWPILQDYKDAKLIMLRRLAAVNEDPQLLGDGPLLEPGEGLATNLLDEKPVKGAGKMNDSKFQDLKEKKKKYKRREKMSAELSCCYCGDRHRYDDCPSKPRGTGRQHDMNIRRNAGDGLVSSQPVDMGYEKLFHSHVSEHSGSSHHHYHGGQGYNGGRYEEEDHREEKRHWKRLSEEGEIDPLLDYEREGRTEHKRKKYGR